MSKNAIKVSELNSYIKKLLGMDYLLRNIDIIGEISNLKEHSNGNIYFSLKDDKARINSIIYSSHTNIDFKLEEGLSVIATGIVSYYEREGQVIFYVDSLRLDGEGNLYKQYLYLKQKLASEGLFNAKYKKSLVKYPNTVGLITSDTGAAIRDVLNILYKRNNLIDVLVFPSFVQGKSASEDIINGIRFFNEKCYVDTIIIARGGGSVEDLSAFNDEKLAREIFASNIPIISAIGHEIDFCISDFVADVRAATPTNAAELVTGSKKDLIKELDDFISNLFVSINKKIYNEKYKNLNILNKLTKTDPNTLLNKEFRKLDSYDRYINIKFQNKIHDLRNRLISSKISLSTFSFEDKHNKKFLMSLKKDLNKNLESKLNTTKYFLKYDFNYLNQSFLGRLINFKSVINYHQYFFKNYDLKKNYARHYSILNNTSNFLQKPKFQSDLKYESKRLSIYKNELCKIINKILSNIENYENNNTFILKSINKNINIAFENSHKILNYNVLNLNNKFNNINKIELKNKDGELILKAASLAIGEEFSIVFKDGVVQSQVKNKRMRSD